MELLTFRTPKTFGCTVASTVILQSIRKKFPKIRIVVYTQTPDLILGLKEVNEIVDINEQSGLLNYHVDLENFLATQKPQLIKPYRHLTEHMFEVAEQQLGQRISKPLERNFVPKINLTEKEISTAKVTAASITKSDKPLIWLQTKSRHIEKDLLLNEWEQFVRLRSDRYTFVDLSNKTYSRRQSIALTKFCKAGITLDTFLLHGSKAVHAPNVIAVLVSSHPEVVTYEGQIILNGLDDKAAIKVDNMIRTLDTLV
jgi:ADP-heptose:LPS heptosyltransferase